jgi:hypothetical protein
MSRNGKYYARKNQKKNHAAGTLDISKAFQNIQKSQQCKQDPKSHDVSDSESNPVVMEVASPVFTI